MADQERRKKELEDMKKKIADLKQRSKTAAGSTRVTSPTLSSLDDTTTTNNTTTTSTPGNNTTSPTHKGVDFDSFLNSVNAVIPNQSPQQQSITPEQQQQQQSNNPEIYQQQVLSRLSIQNLVIEIDLPPKEVPMYSKSTQTDNTEALGHDHDDDLQSKHTPKQQLPKLKFQQVQPQYQDASSNTTTTSSSEVQLDHNGNPIPNSSTDLQQQDHQDGIDQLSQEHNDHIDIPDLSEYEKQQILDSDSFKSFFTRSSKVIERALFLDDSIDILVDYTETDDNSKSNDRELKLISTLSDERWTRNRSVTDINWSPKHPELVVASYSANEAGSHDPDGVVLVWSINNIYQKPEYIFNCQSPVMTTFFSKFHPTLIVGGTYSGQIVVWDTRAKSTPVQRTPLSSVGHTHPVYSMSVIGSTNANSLVAISTDGKLCSWNLENLSQPTETIELNSKSLAGSGNNSTSTVSGSANQSSTSNIGVTGSSTTSTTSTGSQSSATTNTNTGNTSTSSGSSSTNQGLALAVTSLVFPENELSTFYVGTEEGVICQGSRHGSKVGINERFKGHYGPITSVDLHPAQKGNIDFTNYFISSSTDWTCKLWSTKKPDAPLYSFEDYVDYVYDSRWSPVHPSVFATGDGSGHLSLYNLNDDTEASVFRSKVSQRSLNRLSWSNDGKKLLAGDSGGALYLYDSTEFSNPDITEWNQFDSVLNKLLLKRDTQDSPLLGSNNNEDFE